VLISKFGGVRFAPSFPFLSVMYRYSHIADNVSFKFGGKECPFVLFVFCLYGFLLFIYCVLLFKKKKKGIDFSENV
jgi:hypothetical protein